MDLFVASLYGSHYDIPLTLDIGAVGMEANGEARVGEDSLAGRDIRRKRCFSIHGDDAQIDDDVHGNAPCLVVK